MVKKFMGIAGLAFAITAIGALAGCATAPDKIAATSATGCANIPGKDAEELARLEKMQTESRKRDIATTIILGVPLSKVAGADHEKEIGRLKACLKIVAG